MLGTAPLPGFTCLKGGERTKCDSLNRLYRGAGAESVIP